MDLQSPQQSVILPTPKEFSELLDDVMKGKQPQDKEAALKTLVAIEMAGIIEAEIEEAEQDKDSDTSSSSTLAAIIEAEIEAEQDKDSDTSSSSSSSDDSGYDQYAMVTETFITATSSSESDVETERQEITETQREWQMAYHSKLRARYMKRGRQERQDTTDSSDSDTDGGTHNGGKREA